MTDYGLSEEILEEFLNLNGTYHSHIYLTALAIPKFMKSAYSQIQTIKIQIL